MLINKANHCFFLLIVLRENLCYSAFQNFLMHLVDPVIHLVQRTVGVCKCFSWDNYINDDNDRPIVYVLVINSVHFDIDFTKYVE